MDKLVPIHTSLAGMSLVVQLDDGFDFECLRITANEIEMLGIYAIKCLSLRAFVEAVSRRDRIGDTHLTENSITTCECLVEHAKK